MAFHRKRALAALVVLLAGCAGRHPLAPAGANPRIVALIPSLAADAFAVHANVVGVSRFTGDMPQARDLPKVADFQSVDTEEIVRLHPDVVVGIPSQARLVAPLRRAGIRVVLVSDDTFSDIFTDIRTVGAAANRRAQAGALVRRLRAETARLRKRVPPARRPSVFFVLGTAPIWTAGRSSYIGRLIVLAGGRNAARGLHAPWGQFSEEALVRAQPDAIVTGRETHVRTVLGREPWRSLRAVREGHVFIISDQRIVDALYRPGPSYNEGLRWLIERLSSLSTSKTRLTRSNPN